jgi:hypothetical protein
LLEELFRAEGIRQRTWMWAAWSTLRVGRRHALPPPEDTAARRQRAPEEECDAVRGDPVHGAGLYGDRRGRRYDEAG